MFFDLLYGSVASTSAEGQVDGGLGKTTSLGANGLIPPTEIIKKTGEKHTIDGIETIFYMAPGTEAPAEMLMFFPQFKTLCAAEDATHTVHNLYTLRGAQVRDAKAWWKTLNGVIDTWGDNIEIVFAQHHWPTWGHDKVIEFLSKQRDMMKYTHDHTLNLMNKGYTMLEVGEMVKLPKSLGQEWYNRDYYGSMNHNAKAVYNRYLGFYSSNPAELYQLTPQDASKKYVEFMGGAPAIITKARESFQKGEYRWVAQVMNHVVFADPINTEAKELEADALEQLGYQTEDPTWRNEFLMGAFELRKGIPTNSFSTSASAETISAMSIDMIFDFMGITLNVEKAEGKKILINYVFTDTKQKYAVTVNNSVLIYSENKQHAKPDITLTLPRTTLNEITGKTVTIEEAVKKGNIKVLGNTQTLNELNGLFDKFQMMFPIVTP
jgi:alkyl sulfatase BDS1-like metallo-beta-lactamase superfamily hydrolase